MEEASRQQLQWWVAVPSLVLLVIILLVAPLWPWSRGWGWVPAGMFGVTLIVVLLFTGAWIAS